MKMEIMAQGSKEVGRNVPIKKETGTNMVPGDYHEFQGSASKQVGDTYSSRMKAVEEALGGKDTPKG